MSRQPIMIIAGGTGGHIYPALAIAEGLQRRAQPVIWLGTPRGLEARVVPAAGLPIDWISISSLRGGGIVGWLVSPFRLLWAVAQAWRSMRRHQPRLVIGMGGFVSGPGGIAAKISGVPLLIHEQNAIAGMTNRWLARVADVVLQGFDGAFKEGRGIVIGNPVRADIRAIAAPRERYADRSGALRLLVIGGSLGAKVLNENVAAALAEIPEDARPVVRHQAGTTTLELAQDAYATFGVCADVSAFIEDMAAALGWADMVICRAGALTIAELIDAGLPAILVPFPHAVDDHQTANAKALVAAGAALLLPQSELTPASLCAAIKALGSDRDALMERAEIARSLRRPDAVSSVIDQCAMLLNDHELQVEAS